MADSHVINATRRTVMGKQVKALRRQGLLPAVLYGHNVEPIAISLNAHEASMIIPRLSSSTVITVNVDGKPYTALVREKQRDYLKNKLLHVDFQVVSMTEKIKAEVRIDTEGVAPAVKDFNAVIVTNLNQVLVEALPGDLPEQIVVDLSSLTEIGSGIYVRDLQVPAGVEILTPGDEAIVVATGAAPEEVEEEVVEEGAEPEVIERGKKEEEEEE
ncbi:MAG: 50S ribosomal protein L25 [Chloroflexi bacterium]|nr:50S ribosomal protein L25 [Chloroflexota bacterium]